MSDFAWQRITVGVYFNSYSKNGGSTHITLWLSTTDVMFQLRYVVKMPQNFQFCKNRVFPAMLIPKKDSVPWT